MLEFRDFSCGYGRRRAVEGLNCVVEQGSLTALLGPNGAGKTSTLRAVMGHVSVQGGAILLEGRDIAGVRPVDRVRLGLAMVPEGRQLFSDLTVDENLVVGGYSRPTAHANAIRDKVYTLFPRLAERRRQLSGSLSGGEQQMLAIGRAMMADPKLLLIDELSLGLMPRMVEICLDAVTELKRDGVTVLLVEQNTSRALAVADYVCVLASGRCVVQGPSEEIRRNARIFETYIGIA